MQGGTSLFVVMAVSDPVYLCRHVVARHPRAAIHFARETGRQ